MTDILTLIAIRLDEMRDRGYEPGKILLGNCEAQELETALSPYAPASAIVDLKGPAKLFTIALERVDRPTFLGIIAEGHA